MPTNNNLQQYVYLELFFSFNVLISSVINVDLSQYPQNCCSLLGIHVQLRAQSRREKRWEEREVRERTTEAI